MTTAGVVVLCFSLFCAAVAAYFVYAVVCMGNFIRENYGDD